MAQHLAASVENFEVFRFGDWLVSRGLISREQLFNGLARAFRESSRIGDALVRMDAIERDRIEEEASSYHTFSAFRYSSSLIAP